MAVIFRNAMVIDTVNKTTIPDMDVAVERNRITKVTSSRSYEEPNSTVIDCEGKFLLPGLIDAHVHLRSGTHASPSEKDPVPNFLMKSQATGLTKRLHSYLYCGVTSVYDAGNDPDTIYNLRESERLQKIESPRVFCTGNIVSCPGGHGSPMVTAISSMPDDETKLESYLSKQPDLVKITYDEHNWGIRPLIPILDKTTLKQIIQHCHSKKFRVTTHVSNELRAREAVDCGVDALAHPVIQCPVTPEFVWLLAKKRIPMASTLAIGERYSRLAEHPEYLDEPLYRDCIEDSERQQLKTEESEKQKKNRWAMWMKIMTPVAQENLKQAQDGGAIIAAGTDLYTGPDYHRELELLEIAGISPIDVIVTATYNAAIYLDKEKELGSIHPGKFADLVIVDENPTKDVNNLKKISTVVKDGRIIDRSKLDLPVNKNLKK